MRSQEEALEDAQGHLAQAIDALQDAGEDDLISDAEQLYSEVSRRQ